MKILLLKYVIKSEDGKKEKRHCSKTVQSAPGLGGEILFRRVWIQMINRWRPAMLSDSSASIIISIRTKPVCEADWTKEKNVAKILTQKFTLYIASLLLYAKAVVVVKLVRLVSLALLQGSAGPHLCTELLDPKLSFCRQPLQYLRIFSMTPTVP